MKRFAPPLKIPATMRQGHVEIDHDSTDDEVRIKYSSMGSLCLDYLKRKKDETWDAFVFRVVSYVNALKLWV